MLREWSNFQVIAEYAFWPYLEMSFCHRSELVHQLRNYSAHRRRDPSFRSNSRSVSPVGIIIGTATFGIEGNVGTNYWFPPPAMYRRSQVINWKATRHLQYQKLVEFERTLASVSVIKLSRPL